MEAEANDAWERSKLNREIQSVKKTTGDQGDKTETAMRKEEQTGNPEYLRVVEWCIDRRCKLLGLDAPLKVASTTPDGKQAAPGVMLLDLTRLTDEQLDQLDRMRNAANAPHSPTAEPAPTGGDPVEGSGGTGAVPAQWRMARRSASFRLAFENNSSAGLNCARSGVFDKSSATHKHQPGPSTVTIGNRVRKT